jgi:hypothetical protein
MDQDATAEKKSSSAKRRFAKKNLEDKAYGQHYGALQDDDRGQQDYADQILEFDHPEVQVINLPKRFGTLAKR